MGAIGSVIASQLHSLSEIETHYFSRSARPFLSLKSPNAAIHVPIKIQTEPTENIHLDWLIICLKEHHFAHAQFWFENLINETTKIAVIRNGLRLKEPLLKYAKAENILEVLIDCPTQTDENGGFQQLRKPILTVPEGELAIAFAKLFSKTSLTFNITNDFKTASWKKLCESAALGAVLCLTGETCWIFQQKEIQHLYLKLLREAMSVAKADGAQIAMGFENKMLEKLLSYPPHKGSSMLTDRQHGKPIELGAKNGIISDLAAFYKIETPMNDLVCLLLKNVNVMCSFQGVTSR